MGGSALSGYAAPDSLEVDSPFKSGAPLVRESTSTIGFTGFYRFLGFVRDQQETFPNNSGKTTAILVGDAYREPMLLLKMNGRTQEGIGFGADFMINSVYKGPEAQFTQALTLELGLNLRADLGTRFGNFSFRSGGMSWYRQSRLTVWGNRSLNRFSLFERRPQTPLTPTPGGRYSSYYANGLLDDGVRYGARAFQGVFLQGRRLPGGFNVKGVLGKSGFNRSYLAQSDNYTGCFQLKRTFGDSLSIAYNLLASHADLDSLTDQSQRYAIHTLELQKRTDRWTLGVEAGIGRYTGPEYDLGAGEAIVLQLRPTRDNPLPIHLHAYRISPQFVNVTGNFLNTTVLEIFPNVGGVGQTVRTPYRSPMTGLGAPVNNRQGVTVHADVELGRLKLNGGLGVFGEIDTSRAGVSYVHQVNGQTLSRIYLFAQDWGPYNALNSMYRGVFENVDILDTSSTGMAGFKKFFSTAELQAKYQTRLGGREVHLFSLSRLNSCQRSPSLPLSSVGRRFSASSVRSSTRACPLRRMSSSCSGMASSGSSAMRSPTWGCRDHEPDERPVRLAGRRIPVSPKRPAQPAQPDVRCWADMRVGDRAMLFLRHSRYRYFDPNFIENNLSGSETMLELKMTF